MKNRKFHLWLILFILFSRFYLSSQELSNSLLQELKQLNTKPYTQQLVNSGINNFPYNIFIEIRTKENNDKNLVLIFYQEQFEVHKTQIKEIINYIRSSEFKFNTTVLFTYGNKQPVNKRGMIYGSNIFVKNLNTNQDYTVLICDFDTKDSKVTANSNGITAPSWLIKNCYQAFYNNSLTQSIPVFYLSQIFNLPFYTEPILQDFLENEIPAVKLNLSQNLTQEQTVNIIKDSVLNFSQTTSSTWDHHFILFRYFNKFITFSEAMTIKTIVFIIFAWLSYIIMLIFVNARKKHHAWQRVKNIWWVLPGTYILTYLSCFTAKVLYSSFVIKTDDIQQIYTLFFIQIFISLVTVSLFYLIILIYNNNFEPTSVDFLISICCIINQTIFIMVDISLFPIFMFICILSILALAIKNNILHIIILILIIFPFIPYIHTIITTADSAMLKNYLVNNFYVTPAISCVLYSIFIVYFRILSSFRTKLKTINANFITVSVSTGILLAVTFSVLFCRCTIMKKEKSTVKQRVIHQSAEDLIEFSYSDKAVFDDTIRTINININGNPVQCDVTLWSTNRSPVLYSNNDYENINQNSVYFKIPYNPPSQMTFSYGASREPCTILITAVFTTENENEYLAAVRTEHIGD